MTSFAPSFAATLAVAALSPVGGHALAATLDGGSTASPSVRGRTAEREATIGFARPRGRRLALRGRTVSVEPTCATTVCGAATWRLRRDGRTRATFHVPTLGIPTLNGDPSCVRATLVTATVTAVRRAGSRGLGLRLSGDGFAPRSVRVVRLG